MNLLAVETSTENCSAAVLCGNEVFSINEEAPQKHAELILPMCDKVLAQAGLEKQDLDGIVYGRGPGSFTGVRIAASTAQGLALALKLKCAGVVSLEALGMQALYGTDERYAVTAIDARMGEVYVAVYDKTGAYPKALLEPAVLKPEAAVLAVCRALGAHGAYGGGTGIDLLYRAGLNRNIIKRSQFPDGEFIVKLGAELFREGKTVDAAEALPLYVRDEVTWKKIPEQHRAKK
ncbi:MAG: tRNA (adenosine(37)-N6)-threonylcarbamoyltransferase complex dimerization subunit type 1 TsaB [Succinivibrio sp.]|jgi:tRNA threonylcarbamoyladenosine biosynthesis protein TsaB|nr:tRNA (adenosine(37)-N6)-threonylcarbamoyltransferase complex dimerization subunit type 1 TsaB [Succinivibrio sp.]